MSLGICASGFGFRISGCGFRVWILRFGVWGSEFGVWGLEFGILGVGFEYEEYDWAVNSGGQDGRSRLSRPLRHFRIQSWKLSISNSHAS